MDGCCMRWPLAKNSSQVSEGSFPSLRRLFGIPWTCCPAVCLKLARVKWSKDVAEKTAGFRARTVRHSRVRSVAGRAVHPVEKENGENASILLKEAHAWSSRSGRVRVLCRIVTWLILPVVICLSQRLSHACLSISTSTVKLRMAH